MTVTPEEARRELARRRMQGQTTVTPEEARRELARRGVAFRPKAAAPQIGWGESALGGAVDAATFGFGDELAGLGASFAGGNYEETVARNRARQEEQRQANPLAYFGGQLGGSLIPGAAALRAGGALGSMARGASSAAGRSSLPTRMLAGAGAGAASGYAYGVGSGYGDFIERQGGGLEGAAVGGALGFAAPVVAKAFEPVAQMAGNALKRLPLPRPNSVGMSGGNLAAAAPDAPKPIGDDVAERLLKLAQEGGGSARSVIRGVRDAQRDNTGRVLGNVLGTPAQQTVRSFTKLPGQTATLSETTLREANRAQFDNLIGRFQQLAGVTRGGGAFGKEITEQFAQAGDELYEPLMRQSIQPQAAAALDQLLMRLPNSMRQTVQNSIDEVSLMRGVDPPAPGDPRYYHNYYRQLGAAIRQAERGVLQNIDGRPFLPDQLIGMRQLREQFAQGMEQALPGYGAARGQWAALSDAEDAIEIGRKLFSRENILDPEQVVEAARSMTQFERQAFKAGVLDEVAARFAARDRDGLGNLANALSDRAKLTALRAAFDDDQAYGEFVAFLRRQADQYAENAQMLPGGSDTAITAARTMQDWASQANQPMSSAGKAFVGGIMNDLAGPAMQAYRDRVGKAILTPIDQGSPEFNALLVRELQKALLAAERTQFNRGKDAVLGAAAGGISGSAAPF